MKVLKISQVLLFVFCLSVLITALFAQEWSEKQKEVWQNVETYWKLSAEGDVEGWLSYFHSDYLGWHYEADIPWDKATRTKWGNYLFQTSKLLIYDIKPVGIKIHGNVAIVHYYFHVVNEDTEGKKIVNKGRWTDILVKQDNKWVMIGDHGGQTQSE
jgi:ketosteroid isomerase-like protein